MPTRLDPDDSGVLLAVAHRALDDAFLALSPEPRSRLFHPMSRRVREALGQLPQVPPEELYDRFRALVAPYTTGNRHPHFFAWLMGAGTPWSILTGLLTGALEVNAVGGAQASTLVEEVVLDRFKAWFGFPLESSGLFTSGATLANLLGLAVAREVQQPGVRVAGLGAAAGVRIYASSDVHLGVEKVVELLGWGREALVRVPADGFGPPPLEAWRQKVQQDRAAGLRPLVLVATAGSAATGSVDDLGGLATLAQEERLWLHVDGAYGALAALVPGLRSQLEGIERADSLAFDLHKWLHAPTGTGVLLVRDPVAHRRAFGGRADYQAGGEGGFGAERRWYQEFGLELSRPFLALGPWLTLQAYGEDALGQVIGAQVSLAGALAERIRGEPELELAASPALHVVLFRALCPGPLSADDLQVAIAAQLYGRGHFALTTLRRGSQVYLRAAIGNHRTSGGDLEALVQAVLQTGRRLQRPA